MSNLPKDKLEVIHEDGSRQRVALADVLEAFGLLTQPSKPAAKSAAKSAAPAPETDKKE